MYYLSKQKKQNYDNNKTISQENLMNLVAFAIVLAIVPVQQKSRLLIGLNRILFCFDNSSQITKVHDQLSAAAPG